jgi:hypothetical protein
MYAYWNAAQRQPAKDLGFLQPRCYLAQFLVHHDEFDIRSVLTHDKRSEACLAAAREAVCTCETIDKTDDALGTKVTLTSDGLGHGVVRFRNRRKRHDFAR